MRQVLDAAGQDEAPEPGPDLRRRLLRPNLDRLAHLCGDDLPLPVVTRVDPPPECVVLCSRRRRQQDDHCHHSAGHGREAWAATVDPIHGVTPCGAGTPAAPDAASVEGAAAVR